MKNGGKRIITNLQQLQAGDRFVLAAASHPSLILCDVLARREVAGEVLVEGRLISLRRYLVLDVNRADGWYTHQRMKAFDASPRAARVIFGCSIACGDSDRLKSFGIAVAAALRDAESRIRARQTDDIDFSLTF